MNTPIRAIHDFTFVLNAEQLVELQRKNPLVERLYPPNCNNVQIMSERGNAVKVIYTCNLTKDILKLLTAAVVEENEFQDMFLSKLLERIKQKRGN